MRIPPTIVFSAALALAGCGPSLPQAPMYANDAAFSAASPLRLDGIDAASDTPTPFVLMSGDVLSIRSISIEPFEAAGLVVDEEGLVHVPLAGTVAVGGLTVEEAEKRLEASVRELDRFARVAVRVTDAGGHRVSMMGAVTTPGAFPLRPGMRLAELLALGGGPRVESAGDDMAEVADLEASRVIRDGKPLPVNVLAAMRGEPRHNVRLRASDVVFVPSSRGSRISVLGRVEKSRAVQFHTGMRLSEALAIAGGPTKDADEGDVRIVRGSLAAPRVYVASLSDLVSGEGSDIELAPGDVVFVTEHWFATAGDVMTRLTPLLATAAVSAALAK